MERKSTTRVQVKDADEGRVRVVFATLGVVDKDGDVTEAGAFKSGQPVVVSAYQHGSWQGALPVGKGVIAEDGDEAVADLEFFMDTTHGRDTFLTVKALGDQQEWSYSLHNVKARKGTHEGRGVRFIEGVDVKEVSPVLVGAGVNTRTLDVKSDDGQKALASSVTRLLSQAGRARWADAYTWVHDWDVDAGTVVYGIEPRGGGAMSLVQVDFTRTDTAAELGDTETEVHETSVFLPKSAAGRLSFREHADLVMAEVGELRKRAGAVVALRAQKGKHLGDASRKALADTAAELDDASTELTALLWDRDDTTTTDDEGDPAADLAVELLRWNTLQPMIGDLQCP